MVRRWNGWKHWWRDTLWNDAAPAHYGWLRVPVGALVAFSRSGCAQKAAALTFTTLLSLIPLLAIMFALLKGLGVHNDLEPLLLKHLSVGSEEVVSRIIGYINNTNVARLGSIGLVMLVFTVLALISSIEKNFNELWHVDETRSLFRRFADYFSVVTLGPLFMLAAVSMNTSLRNQQLVQWLLAKPLFGDALLLLFEVLPFVIVWVAFVFLYLFVPNTKVNLLSAAIGGISAGSLWLLTQWGYVNFQYGAAKYNAIYGTMAALPIFMVWIYLSWMIALLGLQVCWAHQNRRRLGRLLWQRNITCWQPLQLVELLLLIYGRFRRAEECWEVDELLTTVEMPLVAAKCALAHLCRRGVVIQMVDEGSGREVVLPQIAAEAVNLLDIVINERTFAHLPDEIATVERHLHQLRRSMIEPLSLPTLLDAAAAHATTARQ